MKIVQGLEDYKIKDIEKIVLSHIHSLRESFHFEDLNFSIQNITLFGSRMTGSAKANSDLDVLIEYTGKSLEADIFNALNDKSAKLEIEHIWVDFFPKNIND